MADEELTDLTELTGVDNSDLMYIVDVSDTSDSPDGSSRKVEVQRVLGGDGNVLRHGADPTGVADSTAAFQAAIDSGYGVYVPYGKYRITSSLTITKPKNIQFEQRNARHPDRENDTAQELAKIVAYNNINVFDIQCENVFIDSPVVDTSNILDHTKAVFYYPIVTNGRGSGGNSDYGGWGGGVKDFIIIGYNWRDSSSATAGQTTKPVGVGTIAIHLDVENSTTTGAYLYFHDWSGVTWNCQRGFYATARPDGYSITLNNCSVDLQCNKTMSAFYNESVSNMRVRVRHQARHMFTDPNEGYYPSVYNTVDALYIQNRFYDFGKADSNGFVANQTPFELYGSAEFTELDRVIQSKSNALQHIQTEGRLSMPVGFFNRHGGNSLFGVFQPELHDIFQPYALDAIASGTYVLEAYQGITDTTTAVSDCVFANQSDKEVDITSALGELPTLLVGHKFTLEDHSESDNNAKYEVLSVITDGYHCEKRPLNDVPLGEASLPYYTDPVDASAEAVNVITGYEAMTDDSATESVSTSSDITFTNKDNAFKSYGTLAVAEWNAQAVTDKDYVEIYIDSGARSIIRMWVIVANTDDKALEYIHVIRKTTLGGDTIDNFLIPVRALGETKNGQRMFDIELSNTSQTKTIIRYIGLDQADSIAVSTIYAAGESFVSVAPTMYRDKPGNIHGPMHLQNVDDVGITDRNITTSELSDIGNVINTSSAKRTGFCVYNTTLGLPMWATGEADADTWEDAAGGNTITPS